MSRNSVSAKAIARVLAATFASVLLCSGVVYRFTGAAVAAEVAPESDSLEEVVVTATRRQQDVQRVPISIAAFSAADLAASGVKGISELAALTPGVEFDQNAAYGSGTLTNIAIRGISSLQGSSTTGIYLDDTSLGMHVTPTSVFGNPYPVAFDLDRIEVLRGPQGTLFGAGSEGGTVRFIPNAPSATQFSGEVSGEVSSTTGGAPSYEMGAAVGGPIVDDKLGFRVSVWGRQDGGYIDRVSPFPGNAIVQKNANWQDEGAARIAFVVVPTDGLTITPSFSAQSTHKNDTGSFFGYLSNPSNGTYYNGRLQAQPTTDQLYIGTLKLEANLGWSDFTSISSCSYRKANALIDYTNGVPFSFLTPQYDGEPLPSPLTIPSLLPVSPGDASTANYTLSQRVYAQEFRLASSDASAPLTWVGGLYYSYINQSEFYSQTSSFLSALSGFSADAIIYSIAPTNTNTQVAAFGQLDYKITPALTATAGVRVARLTNKQVTVNGGYDNVPGTDSDSAHTTPVTPKVSLTYQFDADDMAYVSIGKGYREGGVNPAIPPPPFCAPITLPYQPDSLWSYEVGTKDRFFDSRLQVNTSAYHIVWTNIQTLQPLACGYSYVFNGGQSDTNGFDVAVMAKIFTNWKLRFSAAYVSSHYTKTVSGVDSNGNATPFIQSGDTVGVPPQVPAPWSVTIGPQYDFMLVGREAYVRIEDIFHSHNAGPYVTTVNSFLRTDPTTNLVNIRANLSWNHIDYGAFINNALNSRPRLGQSNDGGGSPIIIETTFRPLTFGINAEYKF